MTTESILRNEGKADELSLVLIQLMKGITWKEDHPSLWQALLNLQARARDHLGVLGLELLIDEAEGFAYVRQKPQLEGEPELPRLVPRRQLSFPVSLLIALLRKKLAEADATGGHSRLILSREAIAETFRVFLADSSNEARQLDRLDTHLNKVVEMGFLRKLKGNQYEVSRILKAFVDAQWLEEFDRRLAEYRGHLESGGTRDGEPAE